MRHCSIQLQWLLVFAPSFGSIESQPDGDLRTGPKRPN